MDLLMNEAIVLAGVMMPIIALLVQIFKTGDFNKRWLPFVSIGLGIATGLVFGWQLNDDLFIYGLAGLMAGAGASGAYDAVQAMRGVGK